MIHNQEVNADLIGRGMKFIMDTDGTMMVPWDTIQAEDVVVVPAFGTTLEIENLLKAKNVEVHKYNTTCPFVEKVWNRAEKLGKEKHTIIIHGKPGHEETRATFSHSSHGAPSVIVRDMNDAILLGKYISGEKESVQFEKDFEGKVSADFDPKQHLIRVGVVNQTTMLASETQSISDYIKQRMVVKYGETMLKDHFADTRDTLCYATNDNQDATYQLLNTAADLAIVVGGYNSSNTSHIAELCERKFDTYFINSDSEISDEGSISHFDIHEKVRKTKAEFLPKEPVVKIIITSGASCPDTLVDKVMIKILRFFPTAKSVEDVMAEF